MKEMELPRSGQKPNWNQSVRNAKQALLVLGVGGGVVLLLSIAALGFGRREGVSHLKVIALMMFVVAIMMGFATLTAWFRRRLIFLSSETDSKALESDKPGGSVAETAKAFLLACGRARLLVLLFLGLFAVVMSWGLFRSIYFFPPTGKWCIACGVLLGVCVIAIWAFAYYLATREQRLYPEYPEIVVWLTALAWVTGIAAAGVLAQGLGWKKGPYDWGLQAASILTGLIAIDLIVSSILGLWDRPGRWEDFVCKNRIFGTRVLFSRGNPLSSVAMHLHDRLGLDVYSSWAIRFTQRALIPVILGLAVLFWLVTSLTMVRIHEQATLEHFGRAREVVLEPGLHLKWPWPIDRVTRYPARQVRFMTIGFELGGKSMKTGHFIWTKRHGVKEYRLLLGDGREIISIDFMLHFRIADLMAYAYNFQNPDDVVKSLAYEVQMHETIQMPLDRLIAEERAGFADRLGRHLQKLCDEKKLGVEICKVTLLAVHPPLDVAPAYQALVSAKVRKETSIIRAQRYREELLPAAAAQATRTITLAQGDAGLRLAEAVGQAERFRAIRRSFEVSPFLFRLRNWLEALDETLGNKQVYLVDSQLLSEGDVWMDLRQNSQVGFPPAEY